MFIWILVAQYKENLKIVVFLILLGLVQDIISDTDQFPYTFDCYAEYIYEELSTGSTGNNGYTSDYEPEATEGFTTTFASYGYSGNYVSSYLNDGVCSA